MRDFLDDSAPLLAAYGLAMVRQGEPIFGPLDLELHTGEVLLIEGGNGSGKTTLLRVLAGLLTASQGRIERAGIVADEPTAPLGFLSHALGLRADLSPLEQLDFFACLYGVRAGISALAALKSVGLEGFEQMPVRRLSAGQRKRCALAALLHTANTLWLLDEPYANLDREGQILVDRLLEAHIARGGAALITSHGLIEPQISRVRRMRLELADA
ncbi:MAG: heme ABC exporter ATP-binding protein CcmA [Rhodanobacteraceae bacterium]|nr:heme ABC exporter ATP-binding protein CcmA [Rhodanobacteraceae bacterium]MBP9155155.1 heme ABC exporter ATP-binding protein CcmA [Xanthomonadales bacterium]HQW80988.1 heme ABC exporter ATP-binding protein CcmA [Pseudomonadota bacterium]